jgi:xanthine dehydrogenase molybdopterin-binding subunit B
MGGAFGGKESQAALIACLAALAADKTGLRRSLPTRPAGRANCGSIATTI